MNICDTTIKPWQIFWEISFFCLPILYCIKISSCICVISCPTLLMVNIVTLTCTWNLLCSHWVPEKPAWKCIYLPKIELSIFSGWTCGVWRLHHDSPNDFSHSVTVDTSTYVSLIFVPFKQDVRKLRYNWTVTSRVASVSLKWPTFEITIHKLWQGNRNVYLNLIS